jgi:hypothetical protein
MKEQIYVCPVCGTHGTADSPHFEQVKVYDGRGEEQDEYAILCCDTDVVAAYYCDECDGWYPYEVMDKEFCKGCTALMKIKEIDNESHEKH